MDIKELVEALEQHVTTDKKSVQVHINLGDLNGNNDIEVNDMILTDFRTLRNGEIINLGNIFMELAQVDHIDEVEDVKDWFEMCVSTRVFHVYMKSKNTLTIGLIED